MSYIDDLEQAAAEALAASSSATDSAQIMEDVANGDENTTVTTANGEVKTLAKAIKDIIDSIEAGVEAPQVEPQTLSAGQTTVSLTTMTTEGIAVYVEGSREFDFTVVNSTDFDFSQSFPDGTRIWIVKRDIEGTADNFTVNTSTGSQTLVNALESRGAVFDSVADLGAATNLQIGQKTRTLGYYTPGDGGGNDYEIVAAATGTADGGSYIDLSGSGFQAKGLFVDGLYRPDQFGATGDGSTDDTTPLTSAVNYVNGRNAKLYWLEKQYLATGNIPNFFSIGHVGSGSILRESEEWKITMGVFDENKIFVSPGADGNNDGLSPSFPLDPLTAYNRFRAIEHPSSSGKYALIFLDGTYTDRGIRTSRAPYLSQPLSIRAQNITNPRSVIWDGTGNVETYAINGDANSALQHVEVEGLSLINWSGGIVFDGNANVSISNMSFSNIADVGIWIRQGRGFVTECFFNDIGSVGVRNQYSARVNVHNCDFDNISSYGVQFGRSSAGHVRSCNFNNMSGSCVNATMNSRVRTIENNFNSFSEAAVSVTSTSVWNNSSTEPDTFNGISGTSVAASVSNTSSTSHVSLKPGNLLSRTNPSMTYDTSLTGPDSRENIIPLIENLTIRIPGYLLFNPDARISVEVDFSISAGGSAKFELTGEGSSAGLVMGRATASFPNTALGTLKIQTSGAYESENSARWHSQIITDEGIITENGSYNPDNALIRSKSPQQLLPRLYLTRSSGTTIEIRQIWIYIYEG